jgi:hypothetical protein
MTLYAFLSGMVTMGFAAASLFFLRSWRLSGDLLFAAFAVAFALLGLNQALLILTDIPVEERSWLYLLRLAAFLLILLAIGHKNRKRR